MRSKYWYVPQIYVWACIIIENTN